MIYNKLIAPHRKYMYNFACKLCRNSAEAEDITQQALLKAYVYSEKNHIDTIEKNYVPMWLKKI